MNMTNERHAAEVAAVIGTLVGENGIKLGNEGWIAHYSAIADITLAFMGKFPVDFDWETHMDDCGDCWDIEVSSFFEQWAKEHESQILNAPHEPAREKGSDS